MPNDNWQMRNGKCSCSCRLLLPSAPAVCSCRLRLPSAPAVCPCHMLLPSASAACHFHLLLPSAPAVCSCRLPLSDHSRWGYYFMNRTYLAHQLFILSDGQRLRTVA